MKTFTSHELEFTNYGIYFTVSAANQCKVGQLNTVLDCVCERLLLSATGSSTNSENYSFQFVWCVWGFNNALQLLTFRGYSTEES